MCDTAAAPVRRVVATVAKVGARQWDSNFGSGPDQAYISVLVVSCNAWFMRYMMNPIMNLKSGLLSSRVISTVLYDEPPTNWNWNGCMRVHPIRKTPTIG